MMTVVAIHEMKTVEVYQEYMKPTTAPIAQETIHQTTVETPMTAKY